MQNIVIDGAREGNLQNITLEIPRGKLVVFTGISGSGKSTLLVDVLFVECQRQYLEALGMQGIRKPQVESVRNASPAIMISQTDANKNPRSTVGTLTDIYTDLRMVYEKLSVRSCPNCKSIISAAECKEETEKIGDDFKVYMYCSQCNYKMNKLTRTDFSFNTREGACEKCEGMGTILSVNKERAVNESLSLEAGAVALWEGKYKEYQIEALYNAFRHYGVSIPVNMPAEQFSHIQKELLYYGVESDWIKRELPHMNPPKTVAAGKFEGIIPGLLRRMAQKEGDGKRLNEYFDSTVCPECSGERLGTLSRSVTVAGKRLPEVSLYSLEEIFEWIQELEEILPQTEADHVVSYLADIRTKIKRMLQLGLGYLSLDRQVITLSGGELQRLRLAAALDCDLTGMIYILDEPTAGLHPKDTAGMVKVLKRLRDLGNTVLIIEHDEDVMKEADYIIDMGPGAGKHGGMIIGTGTLEEIKKQTGSVTGSYLRSEHPGKSIYRKGNGKAIQIINANKYNLKNISVDFPLGCMTAVAGVSGSGKSTLVFGVLAEDESVRNTKVITIEQSAISRMKRSNVATYSEVYAEIRKIFADTPEAKKKGLTAKDFSFNSKGGRCENCEGLGYVTSNLLFFENIDVRCPVCGGKRFDDEVLSIKYEGHSINDILHLPVEEALKLFAGYPKIKGILELLTEVGLSYPELGQTLTTLSGGEGQRLKLAKELIHNSGKDSLYLLDEPTTGLHPTDVEHFLVLLNRLVDSGNTVIVVEHNEQVIQNCDWIIELGPEGGRKGGHIVFTGTPEEN